MAAPETRFLRSHDLADVAAQSGVRFERRPARKPDGTIVPGLYNAWIRLDNPSQYNSYTTEMVKGVILAFREASNARDVSCVVFTGAGDKAFCTGGNTKEYAEYYAGQPQEYRQYMRLFNDMVSAILACDKPVICRVNGMRIGGGQEIGMACDFSVAQDLARFGQAGPKHGSAPIGGATDFLPRDDRRGARDGGVRAVRAVLGARGLPDGHAHRHRAGAQGGRRFVANPLVETQRIYDDFGRLAFGKPRPAQRCQGRQGADEARHGRPFPAGCEGRGAVRQDAAHLPRLHDQDRRRAAQAQARAPGTATRRTRRAWLALNMMTEARAGFTAFNEGPKDDREVDFVLLRQKLAAGEPAGWAGLHDAIQPKNRHSR